MDSSRKKELKAAAAREKTLMGVYRITRSQDGKVFVGSSPNLKNQWDRLSAQLTNKSHPNSALQSDWTQFGKDAFTFEILEIKDPAQELDPKSTLSRMLREWAERLGAYSENGYNKHKSYE